MADNTEFKAYAALERGAPIEEWSYTPIALGHDQVEIRITASGLCHSDHHQWMNDWGICTYPLVFGHEIVGVVTAVGANVTGLEVGARVGVGPQTGSCEDCEFCNRGEAMLCGSKVKSYNTPTGDDAQPMTYGGMAHHIRTAAKWAFVIPDALSSEAAAPLLCAGITTYTPFIFNKVKAGDKVGVVGIGGLGHVALQISSALDANVTAISRSADKEEQAKSFARGNTAIEFLNSTDAEAMEAAKGTFDFILNTVSAVVDTNELFGLLKAGGTLCMVGLPEAVTFNPMALVARRLTLCGSYLATHDDVQNCLNFCAEHGIAPMIEVLPMSADNINAGLEKLGQNAVRYRMVYTVDDE